MLLRSLIVVLFLVPACTAPSQPSEDPHPIATTLSTRFSPPAGYVRTPADPSTLAAYLRALPLKPDGSEVHLYNGSLKSRQDVQAAVIDITVGGTNLQQCADAVMRLRAEYLFNNERQDDIAFHFTSGFLAEWKRWRQGERIIVNGNTCVWSRTAHVDASHAEFMRFMEKVFTYAGTLSLSRELTKATGDVLPGDVFVHGGSPGHAMMVVDVAKNEGGQLVFLLAQSYMPAQQIHVVNNFIEVRLSPWFELDKGAELRTPEWTFQWSERMRWK